MEKPMPHFISVPSGVEQLDRLLNGLYIGDNVVWHDDSGSLADVFCVNFIRMSESQKKPILYISFDRSPKNLTEKLGELAHYDRLVILDCFSCGKGGGSDIFLKFYEEKNRHPTCRIERIQHPGNAESVMEAVYGIHSRFSGDVRLVFESLTGMQELWGSEEAVIRFYSHSCPRLYELNTIAYWILEKHAHSPRLRAQINRIAQVAIELSVKRGVTSLAILKAEKRDLEAQNQPYIYWAKELAVRIDTEKGTSWRLDIGRRLREMRKRQGLSQAELAKRVGVTSSSISQVEGNQIYPSLSTLIKIADVLAVDVRSFFRESESIGKRIVFQASEAVEVKSKSVAENIRIRRLTPVDFQGKGEAYLVEMPPDASVSGHFLDCKGEEMGCVLSGEISFRLEEFDHTCREEDVISLTSATPHGWWNAGSTAARLFWIVIR